MAEVHHKHASIIGEKLRGARLEQGMSLRELARRAEISASMISQIETGRAYPSVRSIYSLAEALSVPVDFFFPLAGEDGASAAAQAAGVERDLTASQMREANLNLSAGDPSATFPQPAQPSLPAIHAADRPTLELKGGVTWARLTAMAEPGAEFLEIRYAPGASSGSSLSHHEGREFGLILAGELVVELGFKSYVLREGDSIIFDSTTPHRLSNKGSGSVRAVWVMLRKR